MRKRILIVSYRLPWPPYKGGNVSRIYNIARILQKENDVSILALTENRSQEKDILELKKVFREVVFFYQSRIVSYVNTIIAFFLGKPLQNGYYFSQKAKQWILNNHKNYDLIYLNTIRSVGLTENVKAEKILDLVDAISLNYRSSLKWVNFFWKIIFKIEAPRTLKYEMKCLTGGGFKKILISSVFDKNYLEKNFGGVVENLVVLPNGVEKKIAERKPSEFLDGQISFIGKLDYKPNEDAVIYFSQKVFPFLSGKNPGLKFYILGMNPTRKIKKLKENKNIIVTGFLPDPLSILERSKLIVVPLRFGSGTQYKVLEGMALGKAVITTEIGARGIKGLINGENIAVCGQDPVKMTKKIENLLSNPQNCKIIGEKAKNFISQNYTWDVIEKKLNSEIP